jgi:hypothetical protein
VFTLTAEAAEIAEKTNLSGIDSVVKVSLCALRVLCG